MNRLIDSFCGKLTRIRAFEASDRPFYRELLSDPASAATYLGFIPFPRAAEEGDLDAHRSDTFKPFTVVLGDDRPVGVTSLYLREYPQHRVVINPLIIDAAEQGRGYGRDARTVMFRAIFSQLNARLIWGSYAATNERMARLIQRVGGTLCGRIRHSQFADGVYVDEIPYYVTEASFTRATSGS